MGPNHKRGVRSGPQEADLPNFCSTNLDFPETAFLYPFSWRQLLGKNRVVFGTPLGDYDYKWKIKGIRDVEGLF